MSLDGRRRIAEGREAEIFEWESGAVLKLYRNAGMGHAAEAAALTAISAAGGPAPRLLGRVELDGRPGLVIERVAGTDMLALLERRPWQLLRFARVLADSHAAIHRVPAPASLPEAKALLDARIRATELEPALKSFALEQVDALPDGDGLCHGDFHPGNVMISGGQASVIDWTNASRGHSIVDLARTKLLLELGEPLAPSPWLRAVIRLGRRWFANLYMGRYARGSDADPRLLLRAFVANAAARLWEGIADEEGALTKLIAQARS